MSLPRVVIATAEPFGAYHLRPFAEAGVEALHLIPHRYGVQGPVAVPITSRIQDVAEADVVVITGGSVSAWTAAVAMRACSIGVPVVYSQLAYIDDRIGVAPDLGLSGVAAATADDADRLSAHLGVESGKIEVVGMPVLEAARRADGEGSGVLVLSSFDLDSRDPVGLLRRAAERLRRCGETVHVRTHPREDAGGWAGYTMAGAGDTAEVVGRYRTVVCHPGTAALVAAAAGRDLVVCRTAYFEGVLTAAQEQALGPCVWDGEGPVTPVRPGGAVLSAALGPAAGSVERTVTFWKDAASGATSQPDGT